MRRTLVSATLLLCVAATLAQITVLRGSEAYTALFRQRPAAAALQKQRNPYCPYCDSSVYSYCSDKLLHDACCCSGGGADPLGPQAYPLPRECQFADCSFLHANTCQEHQLITRCCCSNFV
ncbi:uncharacterized protein LOC132198103 [Neocloeon triangulifer]|uniref:uncharacterized protein LOC132198103 n=1 Tax=Neocloeon triangulifer TaxID=2078957 RepID=UPI00286F07A2|nr:uncharacterized protein LOC132198103 [Neocloeon triangulifer]